MPFPSPSPDNLSSEESEALARFVHDLENRMQQAADLLNERGTPNTALLAASIMRDLHLLQDLLAVRPISAETPVYLSTHQ